MGLSTMTVLFLFYSIVDKRTLLLRDEDLSGVVVADVLDDGT